MDRVHRLKEEVERVRIECAAAERAYELERAAQLKYDTLPKLQRQLEEAEQELKSQVSLTICMHNLSCHWTT